MFDSAPVVKSPADASSSPGAQASMMPQSGDGDNVMTSHVVAAGVTLTVTNADQISNPLNVVHSLNAGAGTSAATASTSTIASTSTHDGNSQVLSIITQMKKSHVNDPLMLALTPKTTGDPYGVGPDIVPDDFFSEDRYNSHIFKMFQKYIIVIKLIIVISFCVICYMKCLLFVTSSVSSLCDAECRRNCRRCRCRRPPNR